MRIGILATHDNKEQQRLLEAAKQKGHEAELINVLDFSTYICNEDPRMYYNGKKVAADYYDAIIPRIDIPHTSFGYKILRQFQALGVYTVDTAYSLELARNKLRCFQYMMRKGVPFPATAFSHAMEGYDNIIKTFGDPPFVIKLSEGTHGIGVFLAEDQKQAVNFLRTFEQFDAEIMLQEYIAESAGTDLRCFVVGGKVIASIQREAQDGDFRANIALGGHSKEAKLTKEEEEVALMAAESMGMAVAGVDIIRSNRGPLVIEINGSPDFTGPWQLEEICGVDIAMSIIEFVEEAKARHDKGEGVWLGPRLD